MRQMKRGEDKVKGTDERKKMRSNDRHKTNGERK